MSASLYSFDAAARLSWPGWERISTHFDTHSHEFRVLLSVSVRTLDAYMADEGRLMGRLLSEGQLNLIARRIELNRRAHGLRRYGRKRNK